MSALAGINFNEPSQPQHTWIANFAQPRIGCRETTSTFPHVWARYYEHGDLVTELPYNSMQYTDASCQACKIVPLSSLVAPWSRHLP